MAVLPAEATRKTRIIFMGTPEFAVPSLVALAELPGYEVVCVVTQPDRPQGRGRTLAAPPVKQAALARHLPVLSPRRFRAPETHEALAAYQADIIVVAAFGRILPQALLDLPRLGCLNVHASLLPRHRGASPIARAISLGDAETGISLMQMDAGLDTGAVFACRSTAIGLSETCGELTARLATLGAELLAAELDAICAGRLQARPQPEAGVTLAPPLAKSDGALQFANEAEALGRQVRAMAPWPGAYTFFGKERIAITQAEAVPSYAGGQVPGTVVAADAAGALVACGSGALRLLRVTPAGRASMAAGSWIAGRGPKKGATLGEVSA